jgi:N-acetyl-anhydromuramyl-L-alanine amidase AmpD
MRVSSAHSSPNFAPDLIPVEFVILHYTAGDLRRTMDIFEDPARKLCAHFVLDVDGVVYDLGGFWNGPIRQGAHAGVSRVVVDGQTFEKLNTMSVGIEIINVNGNLFPYTEAQYLSLKEILAHLMARFPVLRSSSRIIGHEHIAGFRGKCDPGVKFDWDRVLGDVGLGALPLHRWFAFTADDRAFMEEELRRCPRPAPEDWSRLSSALEERIRRRNEEAAAGS